MLQYRVSHWRWLSARNLVLVNCARNDIIRVLFIKKRRISKTRKNKQICYTISDPKAMQAPLSESWESSSRSHSYIVQEKSDTTRSTFAAGDLKLQLTASVVCDEAEGY